MHSFFIHDRQRPRVPHTDRTHRRIRLLSIRIIIAPTEHLRLRRHLGVDFETDDDFELQHCSEISGFQKVRNRS